MVRRGGADGFRYADAPLLGGFEQRSAQDYAAFDLGVIIGMPRLRAYPRTAGDRPDFAARARETLLGAKWDCPFSEAVLG